MRPAAVPSACTARLLGRIERDGPLSFGEFVNEALYGEYGFYTGGRGAGRRRDFVTSPETGALFGAVVARALDTWWTDLGRPNPFVVAEWGAGPGTLARSIYRASPSCSSALRYLMVDRADPGDRYEKMLPAFGWPEIVESKSGGPGFCRVGAVALDCAVHVVLANELLDNLAFDIYRSDGRGAWFERKVAWGAGAFEFVDLACARPPESERLHLGTGGVVPIQREARAWLRTALNHCEPGGRVVCFDYARASTAEFARVGLDGWLRTYSGQNRAGDPLAEPGTKDITVDVAIDQLFDVVVGSATDQAFFLHLHGLDDLVAQARQRWNPAPLNPSLADYAWRSYITEAELLRDPAGLGGFTVVEWTT